MATILSQGATGDGYDVRFLTAEQAFTLHWRTEPSAGEIDDAIKDFETRLLDAAISETEEGEHGLFDQ